MIINLSYYIKQKMLGPEMMYGNVDDGYPEAICRALRKGFLGDHHMQLLASCQNMAEFKLVLEETDYAPYIAHEGT